MYVRLCPRSLVQQLQSVVAFRCSFDFWYEASRSHYIYCPDGFALASIPTVHYIQTLYDFV